VKGGRKSWPVDRVIQKGQKGRFGKKETSEGNKWGCRRESREIKRTETARSLGELQNDLEECTREVKQRRPDQRVRLASTSMEGCRKAQPASQLEGEVNSL